MSGPIADKRFQAVNREDDWTGLADAAARRKRQNRLNVRAYRKLPNSILRVHLA
jgi:hypothetical protein